jgi:hypothetical protein
MNNTFNILRMFAAIYGPLEAPNMLVGSRQSICLTKQHISLLIMSLLHSFFQMLSDIQLISCLQNCELRRHKHVACRFDILFMYQ